MKRPTPTTRSLIEIPGWIKKICERCGGDFWSVPSQAKFTRFCAKDCRHEHWEVRLWKNVIKGEKPDDCWIFKLKPNKEGYPYLKKDGKEERVSRLMWELHNGKTIPEGLVIRHTCDHPWCVNPLHLLVGTQSENIQDCVKRGRHKGNRTLTLEQVEEIRKLKGLATLKVVAEQFKRSIYTIWCIWNGVTWKNY